MSERAEHDHASSPDRPGDDEARPRSPEAVKAALVRIVEPAIAAHRCELVDMEWRREPVGWVLRLFVERLGHDPRLQVGGVRLEDCARISRDVSAALDVADVIDHGYELEVSSPGLERPLAKLADFDRFKGLRARVRISPPLESHEGRRNFKGDITGVSGNDVELHDDDVGDVKIPFDRVQKAHLVFEPAPKVKPGKGPGKKKKLGEPEGGSARLGREAADVKRRDSEKDR